MKLVTKQQWDKMSPTMQGYTNYLQGELPGSELKGLTNPYFSNSQESCAFEDGEREAILEVQDGEE